MNIFKGTALHAKSVHDTNKAENQMKHIAVVFALAATLGGGVLHAQSKDTSITMRWNSFDVGLEQAKASHKKVLVDVYTEWCGWCAKMDTEVYTDPGIKDYLSKNFVVIKMNAEGTGKIHYKGQEYSPGQLAAAFGVQWISCNALPAR